MLLILYDHPPMGPLLHRRVRSVIDIIPHPETTRVEARGVSHPPNVVPRASSLWLESTPLHRAVAREGPAASSCGEGPCFIVADGARAGGVGAGAGAGAAGRGSVALSEEAIGLFGGGHGGAGAVGGDGLVHVPVEALV